MKDHHQHFRRKIDLYQWGIKIKLGVFLVFLALILTVISDMLSQTIQYTMISSRLRSFSGGVMAFGIPMTHVMGAADMNIFNLSDIFALSESSHCIIYKGLSWGLYALYLVVWSQCGKCIYCFGWPTAGAVAAFLSQVFMTSSILSCKWLRDIEIHKYSRKDHVFGDNPVINLHNYVNVLLVCASFILAVSSEIMALVLHHKFSLILGLSSLALFISAVFNTYGLGGVLRYAKDWSFWQPMKGGAKFIGLQIMSWGLFCISVLLQSLFLISTFVVEFELFVGIMAVAGIICLISEFLMVISVSVFQTSDKTKEGYVDKIRTYYMKTKQLVVVTLIANGPYLPSVFVYIFFLVIPGASYEDSLTCGTLAVASMFALCVVLSSTRQMYYRESQNGTASPIHIKYWIPLLLAASIPLIVLGYYIDTALFIPQLLVTILWYIYVLFTYTGQPERTGHRINHNFISESNSLANIVSNYFNTKIIRMYPLSPSTTYVMAFHPHGIVPITILWVQLTDQWKKLFPGVYGIPLTASAVQLVPILRDILQFLGTREVSREAFSKALQENQSVILVPGGQAEMIESRSGIQQVRLHTGHKGFLRLSLMHGVSLVPILSFQEGEIMDNVYLPSIQRWFVKKFALPFPFFPYGRALLPIPRKVPLTIVVGKPIQLKKNPMPTQNDINNLHQIYYKNLHEMFEKYKKEAACSNHELVLVE